ncbi:radical SAM/SPASM domain-containing protein [Nanoarchaeota archaeon]
MRLGYLLKQARYYKKLEGSMNRMFINFLFARTPLSRLVNTPMYNWIYRKRMEKFTKGHNPTLLTIENTNACNAKCIMCPHNKMKRPVKIMSLRDFKKVVDKVMKSYPKIKRLTITGFGETTADKGLVEKIKYVNKHYPKLKIDFFTNGSLFTKELSEAILKTRVHRINFSINAMERNYKKITGLDYKKVRSNILYFIKRKRELKKEFPLVNFSLMILKENVDDIEDFIKLWTPYGDSVMTYLPLDWASNKKIETVENPIQNKKKWACIPLWQSVSVDAEGNVIMCCQDYESRVKFGNVLKQPIKEIMNSPKFEKIRELHKKGNYSMPVCNTCDNWVNSSLWWWAPN